MDLIMQESILDTDMLSSSSIGHTPIVLSVQFENDKQKGRDLLYFLKNFKRCKKPHKITKLTSN